MYERLSISFKAKKDVYCAEKLRPEYGLDPVLPKKSLLAQFETMALKWEY